MASEQALASEKKDFFSQDSVRYYPRINVSLIINPNRIYAVPVLGLLIKIIALIPVGVWYVVLIMALLPLTVINSFVVLFSGKYWQPAYDLTIGLIRLIVKASFYFFGLTNKYPGFSLSINDSYSVEIPYPQNPNKLFAIPFVGGLIRIVLIIPYGVFQQIVSNGSFLAAVVASIVVLLKGKYPESSFELVRDSTRLSQGSTIYFFGLSDTYPSFYISLNHQVAKIVYLALGALTSFSNYSSRLFPNNNNY